MERAYLTRKQLADLLGYSVSTLARFKNEFPPFIYSADDKGKALYPVEAVKRWAKKNGKTEILKTLDEG